MGETTKKQYGSILSWVLKYLYSLVILQQAISPKESNQEINVQGCSPILIIVKKEDCPVVME